MMPAIDFEKQSQPGKDPDGAYSPDYCLAVDADSHSHGL